DVYVQSESIDITREFAIYTLKKIYDVKDSIGECNSDLINHGGWNIVKGDTNLYIYDSDWLYKKSLDLNGDIITYENDILIDNQECKISIGQFYAMLDDHEYNKEYGLPCLPKTTVRFGDISHSYSLYERGTHFENDINYCITNETQCNYLFKSSFDYWITQERAKNVIENIKNIDDKILLDSSFKFSPILGTYLHHGHYNRFANYTNYLLTAYYEPHIDEDKSWFVYGEILEKLDQEVTGYYNYFCDVKNIETYNKTNCKKQNKLINYIGYPVENRWGNSNSMELQRFANGTVYHFNTISEEKENYYVLRPMRLAQEESDRYYGNPSSDPTYDSLKGVLYQKFYGENGKEVYFSIYDNVSIDGKVDYVIKDGYIAYDHKAYAEGVKDQFFEESIYEALTMVGVGVVTIAWNIAKKRGVKFTVKSGAKLLFKSGGGILLIASTYFTYEQIEDLDRKCKETLLNPDEEISPSYYCGKRDVAIALTAVGLVGMTKFFKATKTYAVNPKAVKEMAEETGETFENVMKKARAGKNKLYKNMTEDQAKKFKEVFENNDVSEAAKAKFFKMVDDLEDANIKKLLDDEYLLKGHLKNMI
ncbi:MAG: hypothetical protein ACOC2U_05425, partial [bacterium]